MRKKNVRRKIKSSFNPSTIAERIAEAVLHDLSTPPHVHGEDRYVELYRDLQEKAILKKFTGCQRDPDLQAKAFESFYSRNRHLRKFNDVFAFQQRSGFTDDTMAGYVFPRARALVHQVLGDVTTEEVFHRCRHGSGATNGVPFLDTSVMAKWSLPLTATKRAAKTMHSYLSWDSHLKEAILADARESVVRYTIVEASLGDTVAKTVDKERMIAKEPTVNMFFQQGLMSVMYDRLADTGLDVKVLQHKHKILAKWGSVSGQLGTVDFSNASDCVILSLVRYLMPPKWYGWLTMCRTPKIDLGPYGEEVAECYATMGNATTFPVETLVFWSLAVACSMWSSRTTSHRNSPRRSPFHYLPSVEEKAGVSVYGDDCILPTEVAPLFIEVCKLVGFEVNQEKSFIDPQVRFRESCGGDFFHGRSMRPFYIGDPINTKRSALEPWLYTMMNGICEKYIQYFGCLTYLYEKRAFEVIADVFREYKLKLKLVPMAYPDDSGLHGPDSLRLLRTYRFTPAKVYSGEHGLYSFSYCRFQYWEQRPRSEEIAYRQWLKKPLIGRLVDSDNLARLVKSGLFPELSKNVAVELRTLRDEDPFLDSSIRKKGGYIIARVEMGQNPFSSVRVD